MRSPVRASLGRAGIATVTIVHGTCLSSIFAALFGFLTVATATAPAYAFDVDSRNVGRNVSLVQTAFWVGCILSMAATGIVSAKLGTSRTVLLSLAFPALGALLLLPQGGNRRAHRRLRKAI